MVKIQISKTLQAKIRNGYPWVFDYQVLNRNVSGSPGELGVIYDARNRFLALGLYDPWSDIRLRVLQARTPASIDRSFFSERLQRAISLREPLKEQQTTGYRVINGENDGFPGLVLDRYEHTGVVKLYTAAWVPHLEVLLALLREELGIRRCVLRLGRAARPHVEESSDFRDGQVVFGPALTGPVRFQENGHLFEADVVHGHKTGFFLDQRENRRNIEEVSKGRDVLNVFSYTGAFSLYAFAGGCRSVVEIDTNSHALDQSKQNLEINFPDMDWEPSRFRQYRGDAFQYLAELEKKKETFDLVILDPPAFAGRKKQKAAALKAYARLAEAGARCTRASGILFAASCSNQVPAEDFFRSVESGIAAAGKEGEVFLKTGHALDHPVTFQEGNYLKAVYYRIFKSKS